ncbi:hypothetical protein ACJ41O_015316 [Fusarium nematophilum]
MILARLAEPLSERSLTSYLFYQLRWFDPSLEASKIAEQAGYLTAIFAAAQCATSLWWGRAADSPRLGRKRVLIVGLLGSAMSALGMGFSKSLYFAFFFRFLAGALNGNIGVLRTMVSEVILDKRYQSRAFLLLPMCFNVGVILGPLMSGFLAEPVTSLPSIFGPGSIFGGAKGVQWMMEFPYALPNLVCAIILSSAALLVLLGLEETHPVRRYKTDRGRQLGRLLVYKILGKGGNEDSYTLVIQDDPSEQPVEDDAQQTPPDKERPPMRAIFTKNACLTLLQHFLQTLHVSAFNAAFFVLLPSPKSKHGSINLPFRFTGGLGLSSRKVALVNTIIGTVGIPVQILLYPRLSTCLGVLASYRAFLPLSIVVYCLVPYLALIPDTSALVWVSLVILLSLHTLSRVFVTPATMMLINDSAPSPSLLGTMHGFASSVSSGARIIGPTLGGAALAWGLANNIVGIPFWGLAFIALSNWGLLFWVKDALIPR